METKSEDVLLKQGLPQGSVLGPVLFTLYTSPVSDICQKLNILFHGYADDTYNYLSFKPSRANFNENCIMQLQSCIQDIRVWMRTNFLKLNGERTEFTMFGTRQHLAKINVSDTTLKIGTDDTECIAEVRDLGFQLDSKLQNIKHINKIVMSSHITHRNIARVRRPLDMDTTKILVQALVLSQIDYCNILLLRTPEIHLSKLQRIQNMACRLICNVKKSDSISPHLKDHC